VAKISETIVQRRRLGYFTVILVVFGVLLVARLFYLQVLQHGHYIAQASREHTRKYQVPARRGELYLRDGSGLSPIALNQTLKLVYADPRYVGDKAEAARKLASVTGGSAADYESRLNKGIEYAVLADRVPADVAKKIKALNLPGVALVDQDYRTYPEGQLAAQALGFVNADGVGQYGVEGYLNDKLGGIPGQLAAKTDTHGIPIATADNISKLPQDGTSYVLTIDRNIQAMVESELKQQVDKVKAKSGSVVVMDPATGAVKAMANYPTFDPNNYSQVKDYSVFVNQVVSTHFEPGSGIKAFTTAAALDQGKIKPDTKYDDAGFVKIGDRTINNASVDKPGNGKTMTIVLRDSLNTGVVFMLKMLGGDPNKITSSGKKTLYDYFTKHFGFGERTGIEQANEASGYIPAPNTNDVTYANMAFGQGMSATMIQMAAAMGAVANGGKLYQPHVVDSVMKPDGSTEPVSPKLVSDHVMSPAAIEDLNGMLQVVVAHGSGYLAGQMNPHYKIAGKTGTAQIPRPDGKGYIDGANIGSFVGFAPAEAPRFVVMVRINEPGVAGFAETTTVPVFGDICNWLFKYYGIAPSS
jgi:stage V sporulation protein D (sporulation-specific penicillin-binding protein)